MTPPRPVRRVKPKFGFNSPTTIPKRPITKPERKLKPKKDPDRRINPFKPGPGIQPSPKN